MWGKGPWLPYLDRTEKFHFNDESNHVNLATIEASFTIARLGLQGTLIGSIFCVLTIVAIVYSPVFLTRDIIKGWEIVGVVFFMFAAVAFFGAFVFKRALAFSVGVGRLRFGASAPAPGDTSDLSAPAVPSDRMVVVVGLGAIVVIVAGLLFAPLQRWPPQCSLP
jgi:hypothetical protein